MVSRSRSQINALRTCDGKSGPRLANGAPSSNRLFGTEEASGLEKRFWGNAKPPTTNELAWIKSFGHYPDFAPNHGKLSKRLTLQVANLKQATRVIVYHHYLHRGRTMAQLAYWILIDDVQVGVILFSLPRLSVPLDGIPPMNVLELARLWLSPDVQGHHVQDSQGEQHAVSTATCAVGKALRAIRRDWCRRYPSMPDIYAVVSWADTVHHEGTIYRAANFVETGSSGGNMHGNRRRANGGRDQWNLDYAHVKTRFLYKYPAPLTDRQKEQRLERATAKQLRLLGEAGAF